MLNEKQMLQPNSARIFVLFLLFSIQYVIDISAEAIQYEKGTLQLHIAWQSMNLQGKLIIHFTFLSFSLDCFRFFDLLFRLLWAVG